MIVEAVQRNSSSRFTTIRKLAKNRYFAMSISIIVVQQILIVLTVYFLATASTTSVRDVAITHFLLYLSISLLAFIAGEIHTYYFELWRLHSIRNFQSDTVQKHRLSPGDFANAEEGAKITTIFSNSGPNVIVNVCNYTINSISIFLNSFLTAGAVAAFVDYRFGVAYLLSLSLCIMYVYCLSEIATRYAQAVTEQSVAVIAQAERMWPNLTLKNRLCETSWKKRLSEFYASYIAIFTKESRIRYASSITLQLLSFGPTLLLILYLLLSEQTFETSLPALLVTAPRILSLLYMLSELSYVLFGWNHLKGQMSIIKVLSSPLAAQGGTISWQKLKIRFCEKNLRIHSIDRFLERIAKRRNGRFTIRGSNGSGKTTLLLALKNALGESAFYLPPSSKLDFDEISELDSTGEKKLAEILAALNDTSVDTLLLDEWDANLDSRNARDIDQLLDLASTKRTIVEIKH